MANVNHTMATMNAYLARGEACRQTNGLPDGGRTYDWTAATAAKSRGRRERRG